MALLGKLGCARVVYGVAGQAGPCMGGGALEVFLQAREHPSHL